MLDFAASHPGYVLNRRRSCNGCHRSPDGGSRFACDCGHGCSLRHVHLGGGRAQARAGATWSSVWYLLSSYAVISYTENWVYVAFAAVGSWLGAYATITFLHRPPGGPPVGAAPE